MLIYIFNSIWALTFQVLFLYPRCSILIFTRLGTPYLPIDSSQLLGAVWRSQKFLFCLFPFHPSLTKTVFCGIKEQTHKSKLLTPTVTTDFCSLRICGFRVQLCPKKPPQNLSSLLPCDFLIFTILTSKRYVSQTSYSSFIIVDLLFLCGVLI